MGDLFDWSPEMNIRDDDMPIQPIPELLNPSPVRDFNYDQKRSDLFDALDVIKDGMFNEVWTIDEIEGWMEYLRRYDLRLWAEREDQAQGRPYDRPYVERLDDWVMVESAWDEGRFGITCPDLSAEFGIEREQHSSYTWVRWWSGPVPCSPEPTHLLKIVEI